jgi:hypothetical protein
MAFKYKASFTVPLRDYWLSLPYHHNYDTAQSICKAIGPYTAMVSRYHSELQYRVDWTCPWGTDFHPVPGEGLFVRVLGTETAIFTGSHDPNLKIPIGGFNHPGRDYYLSIPYHTTATVAQDLCREIPHASLVTRFDTQSGIAQSWTCPWGDNFAIQPGEALRVRVYQRSDGFIPAHY